MPVLNDSDYKAPLLLKHRHLQTIYPSLFRKIRPVRYNRVRISTADHDFLDLDFSYTGSERLVIILHGLEGNAGRKYVLGMVNIFNEGGYDTVSLNFRGCSGEPNRQLRFYHSGETGDLHSVVQYVAGLGYKTVHAVGFSLGGNVLLKYIGEQAGGIAPCFRSAVAVSVPCDLKDSSVELGKWHNGLYMKRFIRELGGKLELKTKQFPGQISMENYSLIRTFKEFDDRYTAPIHGFPDAETYWRQCSSAGFLERICIPTLLINALDDPFLGKGCYPYEAARRNPFFYLETPRNGGHVGFVTFGDRFYWSERRAFRFIDKGR